MSFRCVSTFIYVVTRIFGRPLHFSLNRFVIYSIYFSRPPLSPALQYELQFAATTVGPSPVDDLTEGEVDNTHTGAADGVLRPDISSSPDGKAARPSTPSNKAPAAFGTPVATIRGAVTPASCEWRHKIYGELLATRAPVFYFPRGGVCMYVFSR